MTTTNKTHNMKKAAFIVVGIVITSLIVLLLTTIHKKNQEIETLSQNESLSTQQPIVIQDNKVTGDVQQIRIEVLKDATDLVKDLYTDIGGATGVENFLKDLEKKDYSKVSQSVKDRIRLVDTLDTDDMRSMSYQALVATAYVNDMSTGEKGIIDPIGSDVDTLVFVDAEKGIAQVPTSAFSGKTSYTSLEFVYDEGQWVFNPYSAIESGLLSSIYQSYTSQ